MKILFLQPPKVTFNGMKRFVEAEDCCFGIPGRPIVPALLLAVGSELEHRGHNVSFLDLALEDKPLDADLIITATPISALDLLKPFHKMLKETGIEHYTISVPDGYAEDLSHIANKVFWSEPESSLPDYVDGKYYGEPYPPAFNLVTPINYKMYPEKYDPVLHKVWITQASRGCKYKCVFCVWGGSTIKNNPQRYKNPHTLVYELMQISKRINSTDHVYMLTSQLTSDLTWLQQFTLIKREHCPDLKFQGNVGIGELNVDNIQLLKEAGMNHCGMGVEALSNGWLRKMNKPWRMKTIIKGLRLLQEADFPYHINLRYGVGETVTDIEESKYNIKRLSHEGIKPQYIRIGPLIAYKGCALYDTIGEDYVLNNEGLLQSPGLRMSSKIDYSLIEGLVKTCREVGWLK